MSSQIVVHGYIEVPQGGEAENAEILSRISRDEAAGDHDLIRSLEQMRRGWQSSTCSFAASYKRIGSDDCARIQNQFEQLLRRLKATSAHLSIEDQDGVEEYYVDYIHGPVRFGGPDVWTRVRSSRQREEPEELG